MSNLTLNTALNTALNQSRLVGTWEKGSFVSGEWIYKGAGSYTGTFANGKPIGPGKVLSATI